MPTTEKAFSRILGRIDTLTDLHSRGIVQGSLFRKQIQNLLSSTDAKKIFSQNIAGDRAAIKILNRLEDPAGWREISMKSRREREEFFYRAIEKIMSSGEDRESRLIRMLQLGCLPFYSGFLPFNGSEKESVKEKRTSRVSVLD